MNDKITIDGTEFDVGPDGKPVAFHDLTEDHFPFLVRYLREDGSGLGTGPMVGWTIVTGPGMLTVPGFGDKGYKVTTNIQSANGKATMVTSDGQLLEAQMTPQMIEAVHNIAQAVEAGTVENGAWPLSERPPDSGTVVV